MGWRMGSSSPQEGGTTDEDYYGQPQLKLNIALLLTAPTKNLTKNLQFFHFIFCKNFNKHFCDYSCIFLNYIAPK